MSLLSLSNLLSGAIDNVKSMIDVDTIVGKPIITERETIIPISKVSVGFASAGGEVNFKKENSDDNAIGGIGGGVSITPLGFLVVGKDGSYMIKSQGDNIDKWLDIVQTTIKKFTE